MPIFAFGGSSGLTTADANSLIDSAILTNNQRQALTKVVRLRATSLAAFTAAGTGVGKTLTANANGALGTVDSVTVVAGDRVFYDTGSALANSGIYTATSVGSAGTPWVLTRATDFDDAYDCKAGTIVVVTEGTVYADTSWKLTTNDTITIDTTAMAWATYTPNSSTNLSVASLSSAGAISVAGVETIKSDGSIVSNAELYSYFGAAVALVSPTSLSANTDNLSALGALIRLTSDANRNLTGIVAPAGTYKNCAVEIVNIGSYTIRLMNDATSTAANRFLTGSGRDFDLVSGASIHAIYDSTTSRWRLVGPSIKKTCIPLLIDGGGSAIATGVYCDIPIPCNFYVTAATLLADQSGSIVVDLWSDAYANFPPTDADSITSSAPPTISSATKSTDSTLTGWTRELVAGNVLRVNVDSCTTIIRATLVLEGIAL